MKSIGSKTTGIVSQAREGSRKTGDLPSVTGSAKQRSSAVAKLTSQSIATTDRNLLTGLHSLTGSKPVARYRDTSTAQYGFDHEFLGLVWDPQENLEDALERIELACTPLPDEEMFKRLVKLYSLTKHRDQGTDMTEIQVEAYVEQLRAYPADVVLEVLERAPRMFKFFPAWEELYQMLWWRAQKRFALRDRIRAKLSER